MSKYTTQLRYICEQKAGFSESQDDYNDVIMKAYPKIVHPDTVLFDSKYKSVLYPKILRHYYFDEIAHETVGHFIMRLNTKLDEILPYYNDFYKSQLFEFNPFYDVDLYTEGNREDNNTDNRTRTDALNSKRTDNLTGMRTDDLAAHSEFENWDLDSDTPQGTIADTDLKNNAYLSHAKKSTGEADSTNTGTVTNKNTGTQDTAYSGTQKNDTVIHNINEYAEHVYGKRSGLTYSSMLKEFRETFLNIDMMIIEELKNLFMLVY